jgi:predicted PurR-regulated permease PerM
MISLQKLQLGFFLLILGVATVLAYHVFKPFFSVIILAVVFAILLYPIYTKVLKYFRGRETVSSVVVIILTLIFILTPLAFLSIEIFNQSRDVYVQLQTSNVDYLQKIVDTIQKPIQAHVPEFSLNIVGFVSQTLGWISSNVGNIISGTAQVILAIFLIIISLFFFLKDGKNIVKYLLDLSPLDDVYDIKIMHRISAMISSVIRGALLIAIIQAILVGFGFYLFGIPNAVLWGTVTAIVSLIPTFGTGLVIIPGALYLFFQGNTMGGVGILIWGIVLVGTIDNLLMPYLYGKGVHVHQLIILFSVLGGLVTFGPVGFIIGPMVASLFLAVLEIYREYILASTKASELKKM